MTDKSAPSTEGADLHAELVRLAGEVDYQPSGESMLRGEDAVLEFLHEPEVEAAIAALRAAPPVIYRWPDALVAWLQSWWAGDEAWREAQRKLYGPDVAHLLRGVADMIEGVPSPAGPDIRHLEAARAKGERNG